MKHILFLFFLLSICVSFTQTAKIVSSNENELSLFFSFENVSFSTKTIVDKKYIDYSQTADIILFEKGAPALPFYTQSILLPTTGNTQLSIEFDDVVEYTNVDVLPSLGLQKRKQINTNFEFGESYNKNEFYPGKLANTTPPFILRELRGQTIQLYPYQYNPVTKTLRFYKNLRITVKFISGTSPNELLSVPTSHLGEMLFKDQFISPNKHQEKYLAKNEVGEMLIICPESYKQTLQPLIDWKNQKGIKTTVETIETIGNNSASIKQYIQNFYTNNPSFLYLLLVGDAEDVASYSYGNFNSDEYWSDSYYGQLAGDDYYSELFVGRFSGTQVDVQTMVDRTIEYEKTPSSGNWMTRAIGIASAQGTGIGDNGESDWQHERIIRTTLLSTDYNYVYEFYDGSQGGIDADNNPTNNDILNAINTGVGLINYTGHGDTDYFVTGNFHSSDVLSATNFGTYPFVISVACNNGKFVGNTCLSETWLRAKNNDKITGAIAMCGSSILMDWAPPMKTQDEIVRLLGNSDVSVHKSTLGGIFYNGQFSMLEKYGTDGVDVIQTWVFFGDPSTLFRNNLTNTLAYELNTCPECLSKTLKISSTIDSIQVGISKNNLYLEQGIMQNKVYTYSFPITNNQEDYLITLTKQNYDIQQFTITTDGKLNTKILDLEKFQTFPNPASNNLTIKSNTNSYNLDILSLDGKLISSISHPDNTILNLNTSTLQPGNYLFRFTTSDSVFVQKIEIVH